jgi:hypothetical protein
MVGCVKQAAKPVMKEPSDLPLNEPLRVSWSGLGQKLPDTMRRDLIEKLGVVLPNGR